MIVRSDGENIDVNFKKFKRPMGLVSTENSLTIGTFTEVVNFQREDSLVDNIKTSLQPIEQDITAPKLPSETPESTKAQDDQIASQPTTQPDTDDFTNYQKSLY